MVKIVKETISKINFLLLLALCLGRSSTLYAVQNDGVDDEKENFGNNAQGVQQYNTSQQTSKTIEVKKHIYDDFDDCIAKIKSMIRGEEPFNEATSVEKFIFNELMLGDKNIPTNVQKQWNAFRHKQQRITIDIRYMYKHCKAFMPLLFDAKCKNLLLLDKVAQIFPNVIEIICAATDCINYKGYYHKGNKYSADIVCSNFILGVKDRLYKMPKHAKLTKIVIKNYYKNKIKYDCKLYAPQFGVLGWQIDKGGNTIVLMKAPYDFSKVFSMIRGTSPSHAATSLDVPIPIFNKLILGDKNIPTDVQKQWNAFRHQQQRITIDMGYMYRHYKAFMPLLCDPKIKNLLLLDKLAQLFPNVTETICRGTDRVSGNYNNYSPDIVCLNFMLGVKERLYKMPKHAKLTKIVIQTDMFIKDSCKLYATQFETLGWQIGKSGSGKKIVATRKPYDVICKKAVAKISSMVQGGKPIYEATSLDVSIFNKLTLGTKDVPADVQKQWNAFRHKQQRITIHMRAMYWYYKAFIPLLIDPKCKNLLLLNKLVQLFLNVTEIICEKADYDGDKIDKYGDKGDYSAAIVCSNFILGVKDRLYKMPKHAKLTKIVIQTYKHEIADDCNLYALQFGTLGWEIGQGSKTIGLTKTPYDDYMSKVSSMVKRKEPIYKATSLDVSIFNKLTLGTKDVPADVQKQWDEFRHQQQRITIDMGYMYTYYKAFIPLLFDAKCKNLLLLDKIAQLFPNVTEIICKDTDYSGVWDKATCSYYSSDIVCSNFMLGVKQRLSKMDKQAKLTKIVIQAQKMFIRDSCKLYTTQLGTLGWQIGKGGNTIVLMKAPYDFSKVFSMIRGTPPSYAATSLDVPIPIFNKLILGDKNIPTDVQRQWDAFKHKQQSITIDMGYMYKHYKAFMPLLCDPKIKNLLLLDKIAQLFPNVTEIICENTDNITGGYSKKGYSAAIVCSKFIEGVKERLGKMPKHAKLTKIVIKTSVYEDRIKDDCKLYAPQFGTLGWQIDKGGKTIVLIKAPYDFSKVFSMIKGTSPSYAATSLDVPISIFNKLILGDKNIPTDLKKQWNKFSNTQKSIIIDMRYMYRYYKAFIPLLFDPKCKNLLLLDRITQLFPNVTEIICENTDCIKFYLWREGKYFADIVCLNFILGVQERLSKLDKQAKLTKIVIKTYEHEIADDCKLYAPQFGALGWQIVKSGNGKTIVVTREPYNVSCKKAVAKISSMVQGREPSYEATSLDVSIFNKLTLGTKNIPTDVQKQWNEFRHQQQNITIYIYSIYRCYKAFIPLLFDPKCQNLLLLDKIAQLFPNVTEIICGHTNYVGKDAKEYSPDILGYSAAIVSSNFMLGLKERLSKMDKHAKLTKIVIKTLAHEIKADCKLYALQFGALGWQIKRESYKGVWIAKNNQITLTKEASDVISKTMSNKAMQGGLSKSAYSSTDKIISVQIVWKLLKKEQNTSIQIRYGAKLAELKKKIEATYGIDFSPEIDTLRVNGRLLYGDDDKPLSSLGFRKGSTVYVERDTLSNNNTHIIQKPLVVIIGISEYENILNLPSVKKEVKKLRELFHTTCRYKVVEPKKEVSMLTRKEMMDFIGEQRNYLRKSGDHHDALIFFYSGHGANHSDNDLVLCSDATVSKEQDTLSRGYEYFLKIKDKFCSIENFYGKPKIFFNLGCRSTYKKIQSSSLHKVRILNDDKKEDNTLIFYATRAGHKIEALASSNIVCRLCSKLKQSLNNNNLASLLYILNELEREAGKNNIQTERNGPLGPEQVLFSTGKIIKKTEKLHKKRGIFKWFNRK